MSDVNGWPFLFGSLVCFVCSFPVRSPTGAALLIMGWCFYAVALFVGPRGNPPTIEGEVGK